MKKIGKFFAGLFTKNTGIKFLALIVAALTVAFINL